MSLNDSKHHNCKLHIQNLPSNVTEADLRAVLEKFGPIMETSLKKHGGGAVTGAVKFTKAEYALLARNSLHNTYAFFGATVPIEITLTAASAGAAAIVQPRAVESYQPPSSYYPAPKSLYVEYGTPEGVLYYYDTYSKVTQWERPPANATIVKAPPPPKVESAPDVSFAPGEKTGPTGGAYRRGPPGCNLFIFHLPNEWTEQDLCQQFSVFGNLISARIMTDKATGRSKGYGNIFF